MSVCIERIAESTAQLSCTDAASTTQPFGFGNVAGGLIFCISASAATVAVNFYANYSGSDTPSLLCDSANAAVSITMQAGRCYELPTSLFGAAQVRIVATGAGASATIRFIGKA